MDYSNLTTKDLETRYNYLPSRIKAIFDGVDINLKLNKICEDNHVTDEEKKISVFQLTGMVLLGVLHTDDLAGEIDKYLSLNNYKFSKAFAEEITKKIFEPVRSEIEKNYRPITAASAKNLATESGVATIKMTPALTGAEKKPVPLGQLDSKDAFAKPLTPPSFSPQPKPTSPSFKPPLPAERTIPASASTTTPNFASKNPPVDLSRKSEEVQVRYDKSAVETQSKPTAAPIPQSKLVEMKKEVAPAISKEAFGMGAEIQRLERAGNELLEVLKKREEKAPTIVSTPTKPQAPISPSVPKQAPILETWKSSEGKSPSFSIPKEIKFPTGQAGQGPVMIHQEAATAPIRPNVDFKLNFPQTKPIESFTQKSELPKMAKIEIGGTTEKQLEGVVKSPVIQPPKVVHYNAFQTPMEKPTPTPPTSSLPASPKNPAPLNQNPFVKTGKGLGDMRMEPQPATTNPQKIKTVDFTQDNAVSNRDMGQVKTKRSWFSRLFGKKNNSPVNFTQPAPLPVQPMKPPAAPAQPFPKPQKFPATPSNPIQTPKLPASMPTIPKPPTQTPSINTQNLKNFAAAPQSIKPNTQDVKSLNSTLKDSDIIDLNTLKRKGF